MRTQIEIENVPVEAEMAEFWGMTFVGFRQIDSETNKPVSIPGSVSGRVFTPEKMEQLFCKGEHPAVKSALQAQKTGPSQTEEQCVLYTICHGFYRHRFNTGVNVGVIMAHAPEGVNKNEVHQKGNCQLIFPPAS